MSVLFTIVIPTYNRAGFISKAIQSVLAQEYKNFEIIVVDDGSTDHTEEVVRSISFPGLTYIKKKNEERAVARNTGAAMAKGDYVNFLDSDDWLYPNHLMEALRIIETKGSPEFFHLAYDIVTAEGQVQSKHDQFSGNLNEKLPTGNFLSCNGIFIRKDIIQTYPFNTDRNLSATEDYELWMRLAARYPLHYSNVITSSILAHDQRSLHIKDKEKLILRIQLFVKYIFEDQEVCEKYGRQKKFMRSTLDCFIALHLAMAGFRVDGFRFLCKAFFGYPFIFTKRAFWGALKNIVF